MQMAEMQFRTTGIVCMLIMILLVGCVSSPTGRRQLMLISPAEAISLSREAYLVTLSDLAKQRKLLDDPLLGDRVARITGRLVTVAIERYPQTATWDWSVALLDAPDEVNAWCMAGGRMAIFSGFIEKLQPTDDELAQVLGHEISHALANHAAERMSRALLANTGLLAVQAASDNRQAGNYAGLLVNLALELPNSRVAESEADQLGLEIATMAGYDPDAALTLWEKMEARKGGATLQFLSTHPAPENRKLELALQIPEVRSLNPGMVLAAVHPVTIIP